MNWIFVLLMGIPLIGVIVSSFDILIEKRVSSIFIKIFSQIVLLINFVGSVWAFVILRNVPEITSEYLGYISITSFGSIFLVIISFGFLLISIYSSYYIESNKISMYYTFYFTILLGMQGVILTTHLFVLFVIWELMVIVGYGLVAFEKNDEALEAGLKYIIMSSFGSLFLLFGIALVTIISPGLSFETIMAQDNLMGSLIGRLAFGFIIMGFGFTAGIIFLNQWLPDAHPAAPATISALLSGLLVKMGIYGIYKTYQLFMPQNTLTSYESQIIIVLGILTMIEGNIMVIAQLQREVIDFKRILAYSTTVHLGYLMLTIANTDVPTQLALIYHIINHALAKGTLFLVSGWFIHYYHTRDLKILKGVGRKDKVLGVILFISLMSLAGLPTTGGFISKFLILSNLYSSYDKAGLDLFIFIILLLAVINSAFAFGGYMWIVKYLIMDEPSDNIIKMTGRDASVYKSVFIGLTTLIMVFGLIPWIIIENLQGVLL
jgi:multicomponent Na+:H+ antiporter subunit D